MKRRPYLFAGLVAGLLILSFLAWRQLEFFNESHGGKHTRDWAWQLLNAQAQASESNRLEAIAALHALGPRALPPLRRMLQEQDTFYDEAVVKVARSLPYEQRLTLIRKLRPGEALTHRLAAINALSAMRTNASDSAPDLAAAMRDPVGQVRWDAARALVALGDVGVATLIEMASDTNVVVRHAAVYALGEARNPSPLVVAALFNALLDPDASVRGSAAYAAGQLGQDPGPMLIERLNSTNPTIQLAAVRALKDVRLPQHAVATNLIAIASSSTGELRRLSLETMSRYRLMQSNAVQLMMAALNDPDPALRLTAIQAIGEVSWKAHAALPQLEGFTRSPSATEREVAATTLGRFGGRATNSVPALQVLLRDQSPGVRTAATNALAQIQTSRGAP